MLNIRKQIEQLETLANEAELLTYLACEQDTREHNRRLALELREAALKARSSAQSPEQRAGRSAA